MNQILIVFVGVIIMLVLTFVITKIVNSVSSNNLENVEDIYVGRLENTDLSIQHAIQYLKLRNSFTENFLEKENERKASR